MVRRFPSCVLLAAVLVGCPTRAADPDRPDPREGDEPGECDDRADNDGDGLFDCDDPQCAGAPVCQGDDDDSAAVGDDDDAVDDDDAAPPECVPDAREEDDAQDAARVLSPGFVELTACPGDDDWSRITLGYADSLTLNALHSAADGDIDLALHAPDGSLLASGADVDYGETLGYTAPAVGAVYVRATLETDAGDPGAEYELEFVHSPSGLDPCVDDGLEDNDTDATAGPLTLSTLLSAQMCLGDDDWYTFDVTADASVFFDLQFAHAEGNVDMSLYDAAGQTVADAFSTNDNEIINEFLRVGVGYRLQVFLQTDTGSVTGNPYTLESTVTTFP